MEQIEFAKLLNPREFTHLLLGNRNNGVFLGFSAFLVLIVAAVWAFFWIPDTLRPADIVGNNDSFGLDCNNVPTSVSHGAQLCEKTNEALSVYKSQFREGKPFSVDFDANAKDNGETSGDKEDFFKAYVCPVKREAVLADMDRGQQRFLYFLLANNQGKLCADKATGARSRLVRAMRMNGAGINFGGFVSQLICLVCTLVCLWIIVMTWFTRRAYLWLYGSYHVRSME
ncbi:MAG TPA: hypothetical protein VG839_10220 [Asticcacaulis sp.]|nr:hypothetical protein [Asticcacaulis sp.]